MQWINVYYSNKRGSYIKYRGRVYNLNWFVGPGQQIQHRKDEYYVSGWHEDLGLILHATDEDVVKIIPRDKATIL
ncbi:hypothetical protein KO02_12375 [Sphingobacterium sp. ML3W]|uniref:hypothetical protein n=1 Tax=Sphingobacterium sp. ML3W TaxID=1538644 RepID=UPI0004F8BAED|nr:hypothetical protein [Sphingobacterium sp. ML3W]AIM37398.1 hypothetical protein KO02_12375 [Sphingobacterium sp. ML3W]